MESRRLAFLFEIIDTLMLKAPHLILDLPGCDPDKLNDMQVLYAILEELPDIIDMNKVSPPLLFAYKGGITGFVVLATSHISIHTFPDDEYAFMDIFSCKDFDVKKAENFLVEKLMKSPPEHSCDTVVYRGKGFEGKGL